MIGRVEFCTELRLMGWAEIGGKPAELDVFIDDIRVARIRCDRLRPDLELAGHRIDAGFCFAFSQRITSANEVMIRFPDGTPLENSPIRPLRNIGSVESCSQFQVSGWAETDDAPADITVYVNNEITAKLRAGQERPDLTAVGLPTFAGFRFVFPRPIGAADEVAIRFADGTLLYNSPCKPTLGASVPITQLPSLQGMDPLSSSTYAKLIAAYENLIALALQGIDGTLEQSEKTDADETKAAHLRAARDILRSGLFDPEFYLQHYPDLRDAGIDALDHYVRSGEAEGRVPNPVFQPAEYRDMNMSEADRTRNALEHYVTEGERAGHSASLGFNGRCYLAANPALAGFVDRPLFHFLHIGRAAKLNVRLIGSAGRRRAAADPVPRIAAQLGVKDEVEIIERSIAHLRAIGVDHIMVCDMSSTDGTAEILEKYTSDDFRVLSLPESAISQNVAFEDSWQYHNVQRSKNAPADWVIFLDADEFWIPATGSIRDCEALANADVVSVNRFNIVLGSEGPLWPSDFETSSYHELQLLVEGVADLRKRMQEDPEIPWIRGEMESKVMARPKVIGGVANGLHDVVEIGTSPRRAAANDLLIAHLPFSTRSRFNRKIENIRHFFAAENLDLFSGPDTWENNNIGWQWRRWAALALRGGLDAEFARNVFSAKQLEELRNQGKICSASELLTQGNLGRPKW